MKNILFVCKHNVFRSKVAEAYFNKINKNKDVNINSAGIIEADFLTEPEKKIVKIQRDIAKRFEINIKDGSKSLSISLLKEQDMIIIVANDISKEVFDNKYYLKPNLKLIVWEICDVKKRMKNMKSFIEKDIMEIMKKVDKLVKELK